MLQTLLIASVLLCLGLGWLVYVLITKLDHWYEFNNALKREIYSAGWIAEYEAAWQRATMDDGTYKPSKRARQAT